MNEKLDPLIIYYEKDINTNEDKDIVYNRLFSLIDNLLELLNAPEIFQVTD